MRRRLLYPFFALLLAAASAVRAEVPVPALKSRVTDQTATLSAAEVHALESQLEQIEKDKGSQAAVLIVPSTQPETIEQYALRAAEAWKLGRKDIDDGAILIVAKNDRTLRIEVGYGLEGSLNDAVCKRIIEEIIIPHFKNADFFGGIKAGIDAIGGIIRGEKLPEAPKSAPGQGHGVIAVFVVALVLSSVLRPLIGKLFASSTGAAAGFVVGSFLLALPVAFFLAAICFLIGLAESARSGRYFAGSSSGRHSMGGSGGGFSGGGGSFGGGGASGSW